MLNDIFIMTEVTTKNLIIHSFLFDVHSIQVIIELDMNFEMHFSGEVLYFCKNSRRNRKCRCRKQILYEMITKMGTVVHEKHFSENMVCDNEFTWITM